MRKSFGVFALFSLFLTACGSNPQSYITAKKSPIVNIEAQVNDLVKVDASEAQFSITNISQDDVGLRYKLFWYDKEGVTQPYFNGQEGSPWIDLWLKPKAKEAVTVQKPTAESANYRLYLKGR